MKAPNKVKTQIAPYKLVAVVEASAMPNVHRAVQVAHHVQ